jgi:hypothetical protein
MMMFKGATMRNVYLFILLFSAIGFSNTAYDVIHDYYQATADEDIDTYMQLLDLSMSNDDGVQRTKYFALKIWEDYDTDSFTISNYRQYEDSQGYILAKYHIDAKVSGKEIEQVDMHHIALLRPHQGTYKIMFALPLGIYDEAVMQHNRLRIMDDMVQKRVEYLDKEPQGEPIVLFNGEPMQELGDEIEDMKYSCTTEQYCIKAGLGQNCVDGYCEDYKLSKNIESKTTSTSCIEDQDCIDGGLGDYCIDGNCVYSSQEPICMSTIFILSIPLGLFIKLKKKIRNFDSCNTNI